MYAKLMKREIVDFLELNSCLMLHPEIILQNISAIGRIIEDPLLGSNYSMQEIEFRKNIRLEKLTWRLINKVKKSICDALNFSSIE